jgi:phosphoadenosine phosphosulfate reductase
MKMEQLCFINTRSKVEIAIKRIKEFEPVDGYWLGFSGGKDSICCYQLLKMAGVKFESHYNVTGIDHPEVIYFIKKYYPDVKFDYPKMQDGTTATMWKLIEKKLMPPTRIVRYCCDVLKEGGVLVGLL